ncbi:MAG: hypothetical protein ACI9JD_000402 [Rhodococcus sp. (in: high G+C Gram-positive bacteria)]
MNAPGLIWEASSRIARWHPSWPFWFGTSWLVDDPVVYLGCGNGLQYNHQIVHQRIFLICTVAVTQ